MFSMDFHSSDGWVASTGEAKTYKSITLIVNQISNYSCTKLTGEMLTGGITDITQLVGKLHSVTFHWEAIIQHLIK